MTGRAGWCGSLDRIGRRTRVKLPRANRSGRTARQRRDRQYNVVTTVNPIDDNDLDTTTRVRVRRPQSLFYRDTSAVNHGGDFRSLNPPSEIAVEIVYFSDGPGEHSEFFFFFWG